MTTAKRVQNNVIRRTLSVKAIKLIILSVDDFPGSVSPEMAAPAVILCGCVGGYRSSL